MPIPNLAFTDEQLFPLINVVLPAWILLILAPRWKLTQGVVTLAAVFLAVLYTALFVNTLITKHDHVDWKQMTTYPGIVHLFANRLAVLPAWVHFACFDLWAGRWIALDGVKRHVPQLLLAPILVLTMFLGPAGLLSYFVLRTPFSGKTKKSKTA